MNQTKPLGEGRKGKPCMGLCAFVCACEDCIRYTRALKLADNKQDETVGEGREGRISGIFSEREAHESDKVIL